VACECYGKSLEFAQRRAFHGGKQIAERRPTLDGVFDVRKQGEAIGALPAR